MFSEFMVEFSAGPAVHGILLGQHKPDFVSNSARPFGCVLRAPVTRPCEIIEIISPGGFEDFFRELAEAWDDGERYKILAARYELDLKLDSVPQLCERFGLSLSKRAN